MKKSQQDEIIYFVEESSKPVFKQNCKDILITVTFKFGVAFGKDYEEYYYKTLPCQDHFKTIHTVCAEEEYIAWKESEGDVVSIQSQSESEAEYDKDMEESDTESQSESQSGSETETETEN